MLERMVERDLTVMCRKNRLSFKLVRPSEFCSLKLCPRVPFPLFFPVLRMAKKFLCRPFTSSLLNLSCYRGNTYLTKLRILVGVRPVLAVFHVANIFFFLRLLASRVVYEKRCDTSMAIC